MCSRGFNFTYLFIDNANKQSILRWIVALVLNDTLPSVWQVREPVDEEPRRLRNEELSDELLHFRLIPELLPT